MKRHKKKKTRSIFWRRFLSKKFYFKQWKRFKITFSNPQALAVVVTLLLSVVAVDWAYYRNQESTIEETVCDIEGKDKLALQEELAKELEGSPLSDTYTEEDLEEEEVATTDLEQAWKTFTPVWAVNYKLFQQISDKMGEYVVDPEKKIENEFLPPASFQKRVVFWMLIHAGIDSQKRIVHDRNDPGLIYGVIDGSQVYAKANTPAEAATLMFRLEKKVAKELKARLLDAAGVERLNTIEESERASWRDVLSRFGALDGNAARKLVSSMRTQTGQRDFFEVALKRSQELLPHMEAVFRTYKLPIALTRIPFVESSFNYRAQSKVGAVGMWQFMPQTARQFIHPEKRELWLDPQKQTKAAAKMLIIFKNLLPDWSTTVTAYNSGVGRLSKLARQAKAKSLYEILERSSYTDKTLGFAGQNFYAQFISANLVEAYKDRLFALPVQVATKEQPKAKTE